MMYTHKGISRASWQLLYLQSLRDLDYSILPLKSQTLAMQVGMIWEENIKGRTRLSMFPIPIQADLWYYLVPSGLRVLAPCVSRKNVVQGIGVSGEIVHFCFRNFGFCHVGAGYIRNFLGEMCKTSDASRTSGIPGFFLSGRP